MKRLRRWRRWFARKFGYARLICLAILIALAVVRVADPQPVQELRDRVFDTSSSLVLLILAAMPEFVVGTLATLLLATTVFKLLPAVLDQLF